MRLHSVMPKARAKHLGFRSEMERQILEINEAFNAYVDDAKRRSDDALARESALEKKLRSAESRLAEVEQEIQDSESPKRNVEDRLVQTERQKRASKNNYSTLRGDCARDPDREVREIPQ
jgi:chromosome segregation ATPase